MTELEAIDLITNTYTYKHKNGELTEALRIAVSALNIICVAKSISCDTHNANLLMESDTSEVL